MSAALAEVAGMIVPEHRATQRLSSGYLEHLTKLAREATQRSRGIPPFNTMIGIAAFLHIAFVLPFIFIDVRREIPERQQVKLVFDTQGQEEELAFPQITGEQDEAISKKTDDVLQSMDGLLAPPPPAKARPQSAAQEKKPSPINVPAPVVNAPQSRASTPISRSAGGELARSKAVSSPMSTGSSAQTQAQRTQEIITRYEQLLSGWIDSHKLNQHFSLPSGLKGRSVVRLRIDRRGAVLFKSIESSSGYREFDEAALDAVTRASPVPAVPQEYPGGAQLEFLIPINILVK